MSGVTKLTREQVATIIDKKGYILVSEIFISVLKKIVIKDYEGYYFTIILDSFERGNKTPLKFHKSNPYTIQNIKLWCKLNNKPYILIENQVYKGNNIKLQWKCLKDDCGEIFMSNWNNIFHGKGCGFCVGIQVGVSNCLATLRPDLASEWHLNLNGDLTPFDVTCGNSALGIWWKCKICNKEWKTNILNRNRGSGCPECAESKGEKRIKEVLSLYNFPHSSQYTFEDLRGVGGGLLKFDVPVFWDEKKTQLRLLIEFDGEQHYKWKSGWMTEEEFKTLQYHDRLKDEYCKRNKIKLLRIKFNKFNSIEKILLRELNNLK